MQCAYYRCCRVRICWIWLERQLVRLCALVLVGGQGWRSLDVAFGAAENGNEVSMLVQGLRFGTPAGDTNPRGRPPTDGRGNPVHRRTGVHVPAVYGAGG
jgi:hypothetical protein